MERIARTILDGAKATVPGRFEVSPANASTHPHVDWQRYQSIRKQATALGLRHVADVDVTSLPVDAAMSRRPVLAMYVNQDGTEVIGHYRLPLRWTVKGILARFMGGTKDYFDGGTIFGSAETGDSLTTTNAKLSGVWKSPEFIRREILSVDASLEQVVRRHRERVAAYRKTHADAAPAVVARTLPEIAAAADASERRRLDWRRALGWATREEIGALAKVSGATLDQVYAAFRKLADRESAPRSAPTAPATPAAASPVAAAGASVSDALQFDRVETAASMQCAACGAPIATSYYDVDGKHVCASCKEVAARGNQPARGVGTFFKSLMLGGVAAVIGAAIYYGVIALTEFEIGIVAILIGFLVGAAIRRGTEGRGGRKYQVMAVLLTYFAVGLAYTPLFVKGALNAEKDQSARVADSLRVATGDTTPAGLPRALPPIAAPAPTSITQAGDADSLKATAVGIEPLTAGGAAIAVGVVLGGSLLMAFVLPIVAVLSTLPSGLISALIIGVGMHQAWKMTAATTAMITGPYRVGGAGPSAAPPAT